MKPVARGEKLAVALLLTVFSLSSVAKATSVTEAVAKAEKHVQAGESFAAQSNWIRAQEEFIAATQLDPASAKAFYDLGVAQAHLNHLMDAVQAERQALVLNDKYTLAYVELGWLLCSLNRFDLAAQAEQAALVLEPGNLTAKKNLENIIRSGNLVAEKNLENIIKSGNLTANKDPENITKSGNLSKGSAGKQVPQRDQQQAQPAPPHMVALKAGKIDDKQFGELISMAEKAYREKHFEEARSCLDKAVELDKNNAVARANLGVILGSMGDLKGEVSEEQRAIESDGNNAIAYTNLGWAEAKLQQWQEALKSYQKALRLAPGLLEAQVGQALSLFKSGKIEAGIAAARQCKRNSPTAAAPALALGSMLVELGRFPEAEQELSLALRLEPDNNQAQRQLALMVRCRSEMDKGKD